MGSEVILGFDQMPPRASDEWDRIKGTVYEAGNGDLGSTTGAGFFCFERNPRNDHHARTDFDRFCYLN